jgi:hypothetical protein
VVILRRSAVAKITIGRQHLFGRESSAATAPPKDDEAVTIPFAPRAARAIDLTIKERREAPIFQAAMGGGWTGTAPLGSFAAPPAPTFWRPV